MIIKNHFQFENKIEFQNISYSYPAVLQKIFKNLNVKIN